MAIRKKPVSITSPHLVRERFHASGPVEQDHVLLFDYAYAEMLEPGRGNQDATEFSTLVAQRGGLAQLSDAEKQWLIVAIRHYREPMLGFLLKNEVKWFEGELDVDAIGGVRLISWFEQPQFANARTIAELLDSPAGATYSKLDFNIGAMRGRPLAVAPGLQGPYTLIEGTHRCCEIVRLVRRGEVGTLRIPFVVGVCPNIHEYTAVVDGVTTGGKPWWVPVIEFLKGALLTFKGSSNEGKLVEAVGKAWRRMLQHLAQHPDDVFRMSPREFEQFVAGCYDHDGYDVTLTPANGDHGRDVIAVKPGVGTIRVLDQVKQYKPGRIVTAEEVRAFLFVAEKDAATKCFITTTSGFASRLMQDPFVAPPIERGFLELRDGPKTLAWLRELEHKK